jgi:hypothetical protein
MDNSLKTKGNVNRMAELKNVQRKFTKLLTLPLDFRIFALHTEQHKTKMRTKTLLLTAALVGAGALTSMAQSNVYSLNVVGYVNITAAPGFNLFANQLNQTGTNNTVITVMPSAPAAVLQDCQVLKFLKAQANYNIDLYDAGSGGWIDNNTGNPSATTLNPGEGFFFYNSKSTNITLTLTGEVPQGTNALAMTTGFNLIGTVVPQAINLDPTNSFPVVQDMQYLPFANGNYGAIDLYDVPSGGWINNDSGNPEIPTPAVGQGYFIYTPSSQTWTRSFTVQ